MRFKIVISSLFMAGVMALALFPHTQVEAGEVPGASHYKVLSPVRHGNLTVFPVVAATTHDTNEFLTLDEGLRSGDVVVTEYGNVQGLIRRRRPTGVWEEGRRPQGGAQVNTLVLVNNSKRPLILLAGEIVTGGKQDRVIGKDRLVPAESDPVDLSVFCVEPHRWTGPSEKFNAYAAPMAQPAVRGKVMADKDQSKVWAEVGAARESVMVEASPVAAGELGGTSSYARVMENKEVQQKVDSVAAPIERDYRSVIQQLRDQKAVGVVVAVNGEIIWADMFASNDLLQKYWPKLVRSYAAEAIVTQSKDHQATEKDAQVFLDDMEGRHQTVDSEPGLYRHTEITGDGFKAFELTSLLPKTGFDLHVAKMAN
jgi:ARG and Rhodanese-Phosphatase-superfamily-associated Protein domain